MKNQVVLVTDGITQVGTAICQHFCRKEARVITTHDAFIDQKTAHAWQREQSKLGFDIAIKYLDMADSDMCKTLVREVEAEYSAIDILVNNKDKMLDATLQITRNVLNGMIIRYYGRIINISYLTEQNSVDQAIHLFTKNLAQEVANKGITVNTISPGCIESEALSDSIREKMIRKIPVGRLGRPAEIARAVIFLAAQESSFITGSHLTINGGQYVF